MDKVQDRIGEETGISPMPWEDKELFAELDRRVEEVRSGKIKSILGEEVMEKLRERMG